MSEGSPVGSGVSKFLNYAFMVLAAAIMLSWAWNLLRPLVPIFVVTVALVVVAAAVIRFLVGRERYW